MGQVDRLVCVDPDRRYVSGFSHGSLMAMAVVCKTDLTATATATAVGGVGAVTSPEDCTNDRVVPWIYLHVLDGLGHVWPHTAPGLDVDAGKLIWAFF